MIFLNKFGFLNKYEYDFLNNPKFEYDFFELSAATLKSCYAPKIFENNPNIVKIGMFGKFFNPLNKPKILKVVMFRGFFELSNC